MKDDQFELKPTDLEDRIDALNDEMDAIDTHTAARNVTRRAEADEAPYRDQIDEINGELDDAIQEHEDRSVDIVHELRGRGERR